MADEMSSLIIPIRNRNSLANMLCAVLMGFSATINLERINTQLSVGIIKVHKNIKPASLAVLLNDALVV
jgi:hypothetical protein